jgi:hypothetical protein
MRTRSLLLALALVIPAAAAAAQTPPRTATIEKFDVAGLPKTATNEQEKQIFLMLQYHKRGDLKDATRIHMMLSEYYKERGDKVRAADCARQAAEAWEAAEAGLRVSAGSPGTPPFETTGLFRQAFAYSDDVGLNHRWEFFDDGTWAHSIVDPKVAAAEPITELGWYSRADGTIRLWQQDPATDRSVPFTLVGKDGKDGAVMDGVKMRMAK